MAYKLFKGKWRVFGDKPMISVLPSGLFCFSKSCVELFVKPRGYAYVKLYYDPTPKAEKIAFELLQNKTSELVYPIRLTQTERLALVSGKAFLNYFGIKYQDKARSYPVHETFIDASGLGYKPQRIKGIEIHLDEYSEDKK